ncbi:MAG: SH3 domain-containing protein [Leptospirales bacterium]
MRSAPTLEAERILTIPDGAAVRVRQTRGAVIEISGQSGKWTEVEFKGQTGWVFGGFLQESRSRPATETRPKQPHQARPILDRIRELTGVAIPENLEDPVRSAENYNPARFSMLKEQARGGFTVFTIAPNGDNCDHYGFSDCINIIADQNKNHIVSDIYRTSFGFPDAMKSASILFRIVAGDGDSCEGGGEGTATVYLFTKERFVVRTWSTYQKCTCCTEDANGMPSCPCDDFAVTDNERFTDLTGKKTPVSPEVDRLFRSDNDK